MMQHIKQINILDMMKMYGEDSCKEVLSTFMCPLNVDVEDFIHNKADEFAKQRIAITFLVFKETDLISILLPASLLLAGGTNRAVSMKMMYWCKCLNILTTKKQ